MDYDKLIEQLNAWNEQHLSVVCGGKHFACDYLCENEDCIVVRAATALSTLQAENESLRVLAELGNMRAKDYRVMRDRAVKAEAESEKLRAELEQVKRENNALWTYIEIVDREYRRYMDRGYIDRLDELRRTWKYGQKED